MKLKHAGAEPSPALTSRRRFIRLVPPPDLSVTLSDPRVQAQIVNISHGGVALESTWPLRHGQAYTLTFKIGRRAVSCCAKAAHVRALPEGGWQVALKFVADDQLARLEQLVDELLDGLVDFS